MEKINGLTYESFLKKVNDMILPGVRRTCADCLYAWAAGWSPAVCAKCILTKAEGGA